jgi:divalent metal cation (Fe/Co/Zn/Cd) transporter
VAKNEDPKMRFRVLLGISVWIVIMGVVGLVVTIPRLFKPHHPTTVQALIFASVCFVVGLGLYLWCRRAIRTEPRS